MMQVLGVCDALLRLATPLPWQSRQTAIPGIRTSAGGCDVVAL